MKIILYDWVRDSGVARQGVSCECSQLVAEVVII